VGGAGSSRKKYEELIDEHNLQGRVIFKGTILGQDLVTLYHKCDLFVLPSKYEAWPLVGLESMSCGLPVLMTNVGGIPEYLKDGLNGFFITQNGKDIAEKVNVISSKKELYEQMSANARQTALKHSWNACAQKYLNVIEQ
ncbi:TPA: glycosyltransferase, partial [Klebsiella pneumoniae]|nr:glycosyltransferase [Klebsiella pneumoniae]HDZ2175872.1 glycosyltransferase [Klebsiella pneumoniae]